MQYRTTPISSTLPSPLEILTGRRPCSTLPQLPSTIGKNMETSKIHEELLRRQPNTSTGTPMELDPGQPVFVKKVGWKHLENYHCWPTSSWAWFILGEISRQFHTEKDQVNDQNPGLNLLISSYRLKHSHGTLEENLAQVLQTPSTRWMWSQCCQLHQWKVWPHQQPKIGAAKMGNQPILSVPQRHPSLLRVEPHPVFSSTPSCSTCSTKGVLPVRFTPLKKWLSWNTVETFIFIVQDYAVQCSNQDY